MNEQSNISDTAGMILAAGLSLRMGETKALLRFGEQTLIERQIKCFLNAGINDVFIVLGHDAQSVEAAINSYNVKTIFNQDYKDGMFTSVKAGLMAIRREGSETVFLLPVDCPLVTPHMLGKLMERFKEGGVKIVYPCHKNEKGHPPLFSAGLIGAILTYSGEGGLKEALARHEHEAASVEAGGGCLTDIDTREEYMQALGRLGIGGGRKT
jgi:molybdenum cofactor cytidylyltransferase